jgi:hypothetical protein
MLCRLYTWEVGLYHILLVFGWSLFVYFMADTHIGRKISTTEDTIWQAQTLAIKLMFGFSSTQPTKN